MVQAMSDLARVKDTLRLNEAKRRGSDAATRVQLEQRQAQVSMRIHCAPLYGVSD